MRGMDGFWRYLASLADPAKCRNCFQQPADPRVLGDQLCIRCAIDMGALPQPERTQNDVTSDIKINDLRCEICGGRSFTVGPQETLICLDCWVICPSCKHRGFRPNARNEDRCLFCDWSLAQPPKDEDAWVGSGRITHLVQKRHVCLKPDHDDINEFDMAEGTIWRCDCDKSYELRGAHSQYEPLWQWILQ